MGLEAFYSDTSQGRMYSIWTTISDSWIVKDVPLGNAMAELRGYYKDRRLVVKYADLRRFLLDARPISKFKVYSIPASEIMRVGERVDLRKALGDETIRRIQSEAGLKRKNEKPGRGKYLDAVIDLLLKYAGDIGEQIAQEAGSPSTVNEKSKLGRHIIDAAYKKMSTSDFKAFASHVIVKAAVNELIDVTGEPGMDVPNPAKATVYKAMLLMVGPRKNVSTPAKRSKAAEINRDVEFLINRFKPILDKYMAIKELKAETRKLVNEYVELKKRPVESPMPVAGGIFYYATRSKAGKITHGVVSQEEIAKATKFSQVTIRKVAMLLENRHGKNSPRASL